MNNYFSEYIGRNSHAESFVKNHKVLTVNSFFEFSKWYWDKSKFGPKGAGSKFSERVFASWVYNHLEGDKELEEISMQHKMPLIVPGVKKQVDLYLKTQRGSLLIEFKCNIDMVEKDLFKFSLSKSKSEKVIFIWEMQDNMYSANGDDSSYLKLLKYFKKKYNIYYFYFPVNNRLGSKSDAAKYLSIEIERFHEYLDGIGNNA